MWIVDYNKYACSILYPYKVVHMCYIDNLPNWRYILHSHDDSYECAYIAAGSGAVHLSHDMLPLAAGSFCILPPSLPHFFAATDTGGMSYYTIRVAPGNNRAPITCFLTGVTAAAASGAEHCAAYFAETFKIMRNISVDNADVVTDGFMTFCNALLEYTRYAYSKGHRCAGNEEEAVTLPKKILLYIQAHIREALSLDGLAAEFHLSRSHLSRLFTAAYGISPISYVISIKIGMCCTKLVETELTVREIARLAAYDNVYHFTNTFVKTEGCTPQEFRARYKRP